MKKTHLIGISMKAFCVIFAFIILTGSANAATFVVNTTADTQDANTAVAACADSSGNCSLRAAITQANALAGDDAITLPAETYTQTIGSTDDNVNNSGDFDITSNITINGAGAGSTIVQANAAAGAATERVFHIIGATAATTLTVVINNLTVRNGRLINGNPGAGIRIDQGTNHNVTLNNLTVSNNSNSSNGGGITISGAATPTISILNCTITNNSAGSGSNQSRGGGVLIFNASTTNITNTTISNNTATFIAGGLYSLGTTTVTNSFISNNSASSTTTNTLAGGVYVEGGTATFTNSTINNNIATSSAANGSGSAGGLVNRNATVNINNSVVTGNTATGSQGGIRTEATSGVGATTTNITNSTISNNTAVFQAGGVSNSSSGAFSATTNITGSTINNNRVTTTLTFGSGGGIANLADFAGSGTATVNLVNSTVAENTASRGGGIHNVNPLATVNLNFSTVASNTANTSGGGLSQDASSPGSIRLSNSIVANNTAPSGPDISGTIASLGYNHIESTTGGTFTASTGDVTGSDPVLGPLNFNGGTTLNFLPGALSPVNNTIPSGVNGCGTTVTTAQNNVTRPQEGACEKGSTERTLTTAATVSVSGRVTARGRGMSNAVVHLTNQNGEIHTVRTNRGGYYTFTDLAAGETFIFNVFSKRYQFNPKVINLTEDLSEIDFTAQ